MMFMSLLAILNDYYFYLYAKTLTIGFHICFFWLFLTTLMMFICLAFHHFHVVLRFAQRGQRSRQNFVHLIRPCDDDQAPSGRTRCSPWRVFLGSLVGTTAHDSRRVQQRKEQLLFSRVQHVTTTPRSGVRASCVFCRRSYQLAQSISGSDSDLRSSWCDTLFQQWC